MADESKLGYLEARQEHYIFQTANPTDAKSIAAIEALAFPLDSERKLRLGEFAISMFLKDEAENASFNIPRSFIAYKEQIPVGYILLRKLEDGLAQIGSIATVPQYRNLSLIKDMLEFILKAGKAGNLRFEANARDETTFSLLQNSRIQQFLATRGYSVTRSESKDIKDEPFHLITLEPINNF